MGYVYILRVGVGFFLFILFTSFFVAHTRKGEHFNLLLSILNVYSISSFT